jgi:hypothetical protein
VGNRAAGAAQAAVTCSGPALSQPVTVPARPGAPARDSPRVAGGDGGRRGVPPHENSPREKGRRRRAQVWSAKQFT